LDFIELEKYLLSLDQMDRIMDRIEFLHKMRIDVQIEYQDRIEKLKQALLSGGRVDESAGQRMQEDKNIVDYEIENIQIDLIRLEKALNFLIEWLIKLDINYYEDIKDLKTGAKVKIHKKRYYIHVYDETVERNLQHDRYKMLTNKGLNIKDTHHTNTSLYKDHHLDKFQSMWLNQQAQYVNKLQKPDDLRKDHTLVDKIKLPNEEKAAEKMNETVMRTTYFKTINK